LNALAIAVFLVVAAASARAQSSNDDGAGSVASIRALRNSYGSGRQSAAVRSSPASEPLRALMSEHGGRWIGSAVKASALGEPAYSRILGTEFSMVTPENEMKFAAVHGKDRYSYDFSEADKIVAFANSNRMRVRGHNLVWWKSLPDWLVQGHFQPSVLSDILKDHITTVAKHFQGKVYCWDVVNEAADPKNHSVWSAIPPDQAGGDYVAQAFKWAHAADPAAKLFYNDFGLESDHAKVGLVDKLIQKARAAGAPIDGIGLQVHISPGQGGDIGWLIQHFAAQGLEVHITEMDVSADDPSQFKAEADDYAQAMKACLSESACKAFVMWGFTDKYTWLAPKLPLIFDKSYQPKPAYDALREVLTGASPGR
jgi:endo-1,4-beta-xylanase